MKIILQGSKNNNTKQTVKDVLKNIETLQFESQETEKEIDRLLEKVKKAGGLLSIKGVKLNRYYHYWYGGEVANIKYDGYVFSIQALGDVICNLLSEDFQDDVAYVKDKNNSGAFSDEMSPYISTDSQLTECIDNGRLIFDNNNWWECGVITPSGQYVDLMWSLDADTIFEAIEEVADNMEDICKQVKLDFA